MYRSLAIPALPLFYAQHMELHKVRRDLEALETYPNPVRIQAPNRLQDLDLDENLVNVTHGNKLAQDDESLEDEAAGDSVSVEFLGEATLMAQLLYALVYKKEILLTTGE